MARAMILSASTATGWSSGSSPWRRESSMICCTSRASRSLSVCIRPANRCTASGSSAASMTASERSLMAPTGVLSSWLTLATKSRRIDSTRRSRVRSSTRASTSWELSGATRAVTWRGGIPGRCMSSSVSRIWPSRRTCLTRSASSRSVISCPRTMPIAMAGADAFRTVSLASTTRALLRSTESTAATPGGRTGSGTSTGCIWRSLTRNASTVPPPSTAPSSAKRRACSVGLTLSIVRRDSSWVRFVDCSFRDCSPLVHETTPTLHLPRLG